jgi:hypothetical protein
MSQQRGANSKRYTFTINNWQQEDIDRFTLFKDFHIAQAQAEVGEQNTTHIQGWFELKSPKRITWLKTNLHPTAHFEKMKGTLNQNMEYCTKEETKDVKHDIWWFPNREYVLSQVNPKTTLSSMVDKYIKDPSSVLKDDKFILHKRAIEETAHLRKRQKKHVELKEEYINVILRPWQQILEILLQKQTHRQVFWVYDIDGNTGKSWFKKYMYSHHNWMALDAKTSIDHIGHLVEQSDPPGICFDIPRSDTAVSWRSIENLKDGFISTTKYQGFAGPIGSKKILVFANHEPPIRNEQDKLNLSIDRWIVFYIKDHLLYRETVY